MRPRAKVVIPFTELDIGMDIMVNFNMEEHEERGWSVAEELSFWKISTRRNVPISGGMRQR